jgi:hypothetical protein
MRFRTVTCITAIALLVALAIPVRLAAQGGNSKIISINAPGAGTSSGQGTTPVDINLKGMITGYYVDAGYVYHDFLLSPDGYFTTFDPPGADVTDAYYGSEANSMNQQGAITGFYVDEYTVFHGFLRDPSGHFTTFDAPGADLTHGDGNGTFPLNINQEGAIAGYYIDVSGVSHGFLRSPGGTFTTFNAPGAGTSSGQGTYTAGTIALNDAFVITGSYLDASNVYHGFVRAADGTITTYNVTGAGTGALQGTGNAGLNDLGVTMGPYTDPSGVNHGYVRAPFGAINTFDVPGAGTASGQGTTPQGINLEGAITGQYIDSSGVNHGFLRDPFGHLTTFDAPGAGTMAGQGTIAETNNDVGAIVGYDIDVNGANHGFLRNP